MGTGGAILQAGAASSLLDGPPNALRPGAEAGPLAPVVGGVG
jgi:hypothetical protein